MVEATLFIGAVIIAVTQLVKLLVPTISGALTIGAACAVGVIVALLDTSIGVQNISVAQGVLIGLGAVGFHTTASSIGSK